MTGEALATIIADAARFHTDRFDPDPADIGRDAAARVIELVANAWDEGVNARSEDSIIRRSPADTLARNPYRPE